MKNKFITTVVATALALTMTFSLANGMDVKAAEITEDSLVAAEDTNVESNDKAVDLTLITINATIDERNIVINIFTKSGTFLIKLLSIKLLTNVA